MNDKRESLEEAYFNLAKHKQRFLYCNNPPCVIDGLIRSSKMDGFDEAMAVIKDMIIWHESEESKTDE